MAETTVRKVHHVVVFVADMDRALYLFQDILGFERSWHAPMVKGNRMATLLGIPNVKMEMACLQNGSDDVAVELCRMINPAVQSEFSNFGSPGSSSLSLEVENLDQLHHRLAQEGWPPFSPCLDMRDPEGHPVRLFCFFLEKGMVVELIERPKAEIS